jgi:predicted DCC family thiol-disulfide oxidoreductase YuxK
MKNSNQKIILFDGVCNLCNTSVNFVIEHDKKNIFRFAALQSDIGRKLAIENNINTADTDSIILIDGDSSYIKSTAALYISKELSGAYPLLYAFMIIPKYLRDLIYNYIAKNRYKWYGKKESCMIPSPTLKDKFLN